MGTRKFLDIPSSTTQVSFVLDRVVLEDTGENAPRIVDLGRISLNEITCCDVHLRLEEPGVRDAKTGGPEFPIFQKVLVQCSFSNNDGSTSVQFATFEVVVRQERDGQKDVVMKQAHPWQKIPFYETLTLVRDQAVSLIPSVKKIHITLSVTWRGASILNTDVPNFKEENPKRLVEKLMAMHSSQILSDVVFLVEGEEIRAHSQILATMSEVFAKMFLHDTLDKLRGCVEVEDATAAGFKRMLSCLYTCEEPEWTNDDDLMELTYLAHKYALEPLQAQCSQRMVATLQENNLCEMLKVGSALKIDHVMDRAMNFIKTNRKALHSEEWQKLRKEHPDVETEILRMLVENMEVTTGEGKGGDAHTPQLEKPLPLMSPRYVPYTCYSTDEDTN